MGASQECELSDILPSKEFVPDEFNYLGPDRGTKIHPAKNQAAETAFEAYVVDKYTLPSGPKQFQGRVQTGARLTREKTVTSETIDNHHEMLLWAAFNGNEPSTEYFTEWCDVELSDDVVDGYRRSEFFFREPQTQQWPNDQTAASKPYREYAAILQSTDWGVLEVEVERNDVNEHWETRRVAQQLMTRMQHIATVSARPTDPAALDDEE
ncbi:MULTISPECIES: hypothetical protein [unclassified Haloferax]|uniref:hypothetical protein n=1 Tax=unclassified Haloferax TaxID=2625095 RepID=UPI002875899C|nr:MULTISPECIES: hypothetical protein [unclassified Haloferax]MDS0243649.1 hypothetical protein [Haloferax sp. S2CR25]MDS0446770.1 hypothetical protein [Haloferax sp. S2CR25-2]